MDLSERARAWLRHDPDPDTRAELERLLGDGDGDGDRGELAERFDGRLTFGTAGIRGELGAGPTRMNRVVVRQTTAGVAARLAADADPPSTIVVVGRDARHKSDVFARDVVGVLDVAGFDVRHWTDPVPTPLLAYVTRLLGAGAGVQITASHNPPADNGYKVFWRGGAQIVPPVDAEIAAAIEVAATPTDLPSAAGDPLPDDLVDAYVAAVLRLVPDGDRRAQRAGLSIVYTPLHGVAGRLLRRVLHRAGFDDVAVVSGQFAPDPDFPTVAFPNPEEPGALDAALALAADRGADLVLANDPDGDRIAAAIPAGDGWRALTGDEIGCMLADHVLTTTPGGAERTVATTVVSSQLLERIADDHGVGYTETLTGLKWLADAAERAEREGRRMVLAYEEALGVMIGDAVRDKDGISAALVLADLAAAERARGRHLTDRLDDLARRFGVHATTQTSIRFDDDDDGDDVGARVLRRLREETPEALAGSAVVAVADHEARRRTHADGTVEHLDLPTTPLVVLTLADGSRVQARPSGTEPKLKLYAEVVEPVADEPVAAARRRATARLDALVTEVLAALDVTGSP